MLNNLDKVIKYADNMFIDSHTTRRQKRRIDYLLVYQVTAITAFLIICIIENRMRHGN